MKIVLMVHQFLPDFTAGTEVLTYETARELKRRGHQVEIWTSFPADAALAQARPFESYEYQGLQVHRYNHNLSFPSSNNVMEFEYNNSFFAGYFNKYVEQTPPDLVHFFHLARLTGSSLEICFQQKIPTVFTPTDFWIICLYGQLRLPDNQLCQGPEPQGVNCIRHVIATTQSPITSKVANILPSSVFNFLVHGSRFSWWPDKKYSPLLRAVAERRDFLGQRMNKLDRMLVPTRSMEKILRQNGLDPEIIRFIPYGLNLKPFENHNPKPRGEKLRVAFIGSLSEHKGAHVLLEAVKLLPADLPVEVKLYGRQDEFPDYVARLKTMADGDKRIEFGGYFKNDQIGKVFAGVDVLVVPSLWYENTPLVIYSAFAARTPVIATNLGGMAEVVHHEENGLLFEKGDAAGLSALLKRLVEDRTLLERLAAKVVPPKTISQYVDELEVVYEEVLTRRRTAP